MTLPRKWVVKPLSLGTNCVRVTIPFPNDFPSYWRVACVCDRNKQITRVERIENSSDAVCRRVFVSHNAILARSATTIPYWHDNAADAECGLTQKKQQADVELRLIITWKIYPPVQVASIGIVAITYHPIRVFDV